MPVVVARSAATEPDASSVPGVPVAVPLSVDLLVSEAMGRTVREVMIVVAAPTWADASSVRSVGTVTGWGR